MTVCPDEWFRKLVAPGSNPGAGSKFLPALRPGGIGVWQVPAGPSGPSVLRHDHRG